MKWRHTLEDGGQWFWDTYTSPSHNVWQDERNSQKYQNSAWRHIWTTPDIFNFSKSSVINDGTLLRKDVNDFVTKDLLIIALWGERNGPSDTIYRDVTYEQTLTFSMFINLQ